MKKFLCLILACLLLTACATVPRPDVALDIEYKDNSLLINNAPEYFDPNDPSRFVFVVWFDWDY